MSKPRKIRVTALDIKALRAIQACGFIGIDLKGQTYLESSQNVGRGRLRRLIEQSSSHPIRTYFCPAAAFLRKAIRCRSGG